MRREQRIAYVLIAPAILVLGTVVAAPMMLAVFLAFTNATVGRPGQFVGFQTFRTVVGSAVFVTTIENALLYLISCVSLKCLFGLALASILNRLTHFSRLIRALILLPWVTPVALSTLAWKWMLDPQYSVLNWILINAGVVSRGVPWFSFPWSAKLGVILVNVWRGIPFFAVNILAGLKTIPRELYEAAQIDGATGWHQFWNITIPGIKPVLMTVLLFSTVMTLADFTVVYTLTRGGPRDSTHLLATLAYQTGLVSGFVGRGAATSLFLFPIMLCVVIFQLRIMRRKWIWY